MRKLDILVTCYDEGVEVAKPLLDSIAIQQGIDFGDLGVIVCCDGGTTVLADDFMSQYPFHIEFHMCEHRGVSATRNECLDLSTAEYVSWSDCDDMYCDVCGLYIVFREIENGGFDVLVSAFREETKDANGNLTYINHDAFPGSQFAPAQFDRTFFHGKFFNREYLVKNQIRSNPNLWPHEDSFFNCLAIDCADPNRVKLSPQPFYLWKWRDSSCCRHDPKYILKTFNDMIASNDALVDEFTKRLMSEKANFYVVMMAWDSFFTMCKRDWVDQENQSYRESTERRFAEYFRKHKAKWDAVPETEKLLISQGIRQRSIQEGMLMEPISINQWLDRIQAKYC